MPKRKGPHSDELKRLLNAMLELISWQEQLVCEALETLRSGPKDSGGTTKK